MEKLTEDIFCKYEISIKLKELGFDKKCLAFYSKSLQGVLHGNMWNGNPIEMGLPDNSIHVDCYAPTWDQVNTWLRDIHKMEIRISSAGEKDIYPKWIFDGIIDLSNPNSGLDLELALLQINYDDMIMYDTYEECRLFAINEALKIINN